MLTECRHFRVSTLCLHGVYSPAGWPHPLRTAHLLLGETTLRSARLAARWDHATGVTWVTGVTLGDRCDLGDGCDTGKQKETAGEVQSEARLR